LVGGMTIWNECKPENRPEKVNNSELTLLIDIFIAGANQT